MTCSGTRQLNLCNCAVCAPVLEIQDNMFHVLKIDRFASFYNKQTEQYNSHAMPLQVKCIPFSVLLSYINQ